MPTPNTTLGIAFVAATKVATFTGAVAIRESVEVTVTDGAQHIAGGLVLAIVRGGTLYAQCEEWTADGDDAVGTLSLNTEELVDAYAHTNEQGVRQFTAMGLVLSPQTTLFNSIIGVKNTPYEDGMATPLPCVPWSTDLTDILADITALEAVVYPDAGIPYTVADGTVRRSVSETMTMAQLLAFVRTLASDLKTRGLI